ncbi:MAG: fibronectin type III domain-containing protein, partial [Acidimicrobiales bacterium]
GLVATPGVDEVTLNWTAPVSDGGSPLSGYEIYQVGRPSNIFIPVQLNYTITGLKDNTSYSFRVSAVNVVGVGPSSAAASATTATVPDRPTGLGVTPGVDEVTLNWTAPVSDGGSPLSGYEIYQRHRAANIFVPAGQLNYTVTGLKDNTSYSFRVLAVNVVGAGPSSKAASATTATVPGLTTGLVATPGVDEVTLNWTAPVSDGGSPLSGYEIYQVGRAANIFIPAQTNYAIAGLEDNTSYSFRVSAVNVVGVGPSSAAASATTASATTG